MTSTQEIDYLKEINQLQKVILKQMNEKPARSSINVQELTTTLQERSNKNRIKPTSKRTKKGQSRVFNKTQLYDFYVMLSQLPNPPNSTPLTPGVVREIYLFETSRNITENSLRTKLSRVLSNVASRKTTKSLAWSNFNSKLLALDAGLLTKDFIADKVIQGKQYSNPIGTPESEFNKMLEVLNTDNPTTRQGRRIVWNTNEQNALFNAVKELFGTLANATCQRDQHGNNISILYHNQEGVTKRSVPAICTYLHKVLTTARIIESNSTEYIAPGQLDAWEVAVDVGII
jgi:hypothetical protein